MAYPMPTAGQYNMPAFQTFLAQHPELAALDSQKEINRFLVNHPKIAAAYTALLSPRPATVPAVAAPGTAAASATPPADLSAKALITGKLSEFGLGALGDWAWSQYLNGTPTSQIMLDLRNRPEYKARFPGMAALAAQGRAISEQEYMGAEESYRQALRARGFPPSWYDEAADFTKLIVGGVSAREFDERLTYAERVAMTDPRSTELLAELNRQTGLSFDAGTATAFFLDPDRTMDVVKKRYQAAVTGATARMSGFGALSTQEAERFGALGLSEEQQRSAFSSLAEMDELQDSLPGMGASVSRDDLLSAGLEQNADAAKRVKAAQQTRVAQFAGGGGYAGGQKGLTGLGTAD